MSIKVMSQVWEYSHHKGGELLLLLAIADHADDQGTAFPSVARLAKKTRMTDRNIQLLLKRLTSSQELTVHPGEGPHGCHLYQLTVHDACPCHTGGEKFSGEKFSGEIFSSEKSGKILPDFSPKPSLDPSEDLRIPQSPPKMKMPTPKKRGKPPAPVYSPGFLRFWDGYPHERRAKKPTCMEMWTAAELESRTPEICEKVERLTLTSWQGREPHFIPMTSTWLHERRYEDDLMPLSRASPGGQRLSDREQRTAQASQRILEELQHGHDRPAEVSRRLE